MRKLVKDEYPELEIWFCDKNIFNSACVNSKFFADFKCPDCGNIETITISNFIKRSHKCLNCKQDGISRPNKFLREFLKEIDSQVDFKTTEWNPEWAGLYLYDGYIVVKGIGYIIEMHGEQHYHKTGHWDFDYQQKRDKEKTRLAEENNVEQIIINCTHTDYLSIKRNVINSRLSDIINLDNINWYNIIEKCTHNYVKIAADLYNKGLTISGIAKEMMLDRHVISRFLIDANELKWCNYTPISCIELYKIDVKITNVKTNNFVIIHGVQEACNFILKDSGNKIDRHTIKNYINGYYYEYYNNQKYQISLKDKLYKDIYKFEYL